MSTDTDSAKPASTDDHRRKPWVALLLSLAVAGLGHIYCGRIVKGLVLLLLGPALIPVALIPLVFGRPSSMYYSLLALVVLPNAVWLYAIVDAYFLARRAPRDYQLRDYNRWYAYVLLVLLMLPVGGAVASVYALLIREGFCEAFCIASGSMNPTLNRNDRVLADKRIYRFEPLRRGDVAVFINPNNRPQRLIKRVVALPDDTIEMKNNEVYVNGKKLRRTKIDDVDSRTKDDPLIGETFWEENDAARYKILLAREEKKDLPAIRDFPKMKVPAGHCYMLGDNRNRSRDSRQLGPIPLVDIVGRVDYLYYPRLSRLK